jgi:hypothetical protein
MSTLTQVSEMIHEYVTELNKSYATDADQFRIMLPTPKDHTKDSSQIPDRSKSQIQESSSTSSANSGENRKHTDRSLTPDRHRPDRKRISAYDARKKIQDKKKMRR